MVDSGAPFSPIPVTIEDPTWGNSDALVTIVEFADLQCPFTARVQATLKQIQVTYGPSTVRLVWKNQPLPFHQFAVPTHQLGIAVHRAAGNAKFWGFVERVFENQKGLSSPSDVISWAEEEAGRRDLDVDMALPVIASKLSRDMELAKRIGVTGTPAFRINGVTLSGAQPFEKFHLIIEQQLKAAAELLAMGMPRQQISAHLTVRNFSEAPEPLPTPAASAPAADTDVWKVPVLPSDPQLGKKDALVTIVQFSDFQCPFCERVEGTLTAVRERYGDAVRVVWKDNPLPFHANAKPAARLARHVFATKGNAGFWKAHAMLFENQRELGAERFEEITTELGLSWANATKAIDSGRYDKEIQSSIDLAMDFNARGTPHFFINGRRLSGSQPLEKFVALIDEQLAKAKELQAKGVPKSAIYAKTIEDGRAPAEPETKKPPLVTAQNPTLGPANAPVVIQVFSDFQCPYCGRVQSTLTELRQRYPKDVRLVFRHMPLPFHADAGLAAEASVEVFEQKGSAGFWAFHDLLFANQRALGRDDLRATAQGLNLNLTQFDQALDTHRHSARVKDDADAASAVGLNGTPAFLINEYFLSGAQPVEAFVKLVELAKIKHKVKAP